VLSCIVYLNDAWDARDGGALRLHLRGGARDVLPVGGTLVAFLSDRVEHEVLAATRERLSVAAWFRRRTSSG
jgi:SM-20-related protein